MIKVKVKVEVKSLVPNTKVFESYIQFNENELSPFWDEEGLYDLIQQASVAEGVVIKNPTVYNELSNYLENAYNIIAESAVWVKHVFDYEVIIEATDEESIDLEILVTPDWDSFIKSKLRAMVAKSKQFSLTSRKNSKLH